MSSRNRGEKVGLEGGEEGGGGRGVHEPKPRGTQRQNSRVWSYVPSGLGREQLTVYESAREIQSDGRNVKSSRKHRVGKATVGMSHPAVQQASRPGWPVIVINDAAAWP